MSGLACHKTYYGGELRVRRKKGHETCCTLQNSFFIGLLAKFPCVTSCISFQSFSGSRSEPSSEHKHYGNHSGKNKSDILDFSVIVDHQLESVEIYVVSLDDFVNSFTCDEAAAKFWVVQVG